MSRYRNGCQKIFMPNRPPGKKENCPFLDSPLVDAIQILKLIVYFTVKTITISTIVNSQKFDWLIVLRK
jgi:hypothetical protein